MNGTMIEKVFDGGAAARFEDVDEMRDTIDAAKAGAEWATERLLLVYGQALRGVLRSYRGTLDDDDARSTVLLALVEAVASYDAPDDEGGLFLAHLTTTAQRLLSEAAARETSLAIAPRTLQRFHGIMRRAEGDVAEALRICSDHRMPRETFLAVLEAVQSESIEGSDDGARIAHEARPLWQGTDAFADAEDRLLVAAAFEVVDDVEEGVIRDAYGFSDYRPLPDGVIAEKRGMTRPTVQRRRASGLSKMRDALAVDEI